jgi:hypothetical protein
MTLGNMRDQLDSLRMRISSSHGAAVTKIKT